MQNYGPVTENKISEVVETCRRYGSTSIVALAGVPGTGKSFIAEIAAQRIASDPLLVREVQFHPSFSYEQFIEGMKLDRDGGASPLPGIFLDWNQRALEDPGQRYVLLIEELTRANVSAVLGELMTYIEHRDRSFLTLYSRRPVTIAPNIALLATYNPTDRSAINLDTAFIRRLRIVRFPPSAAQLAEMLVSTNLKEAVIKRLQTLFEKCQAEFPDDFSNLMPFGHGIFADVVDEVPDLHALWQERIEHLLKRPLLEPHPFASVIEESYPWKNPNYREPQPQNT